MLVSLVDHSVWPKQGLRAPCAQSNVFNLVHDTNMLTHVVYLPHRPQFFSNTCSMVTLRLELWTLSIASCLRNNNDDYYFVSLHTVDCVFCVASICQGWAPPADLGLFLAVFFYYIFPRLSAKVSMFILLLVRFCLCKAWLVRLTAYSSYLLYFWGD